MLKFVMAALVALEIVLLSSWVIPPANATSPNSEVYIWDYASVGNSQMVCKKVVFHVENRPLPPGVEVQPARIDSRIVNDVDCSHLTKPILK
ncbi:MULTISPECIES: hypothetical protein [Planktothrix]|jgi:hypothetical protein|uniref:Uncharacterized protein n=4 Tax=Planktothrix TaxID=54304 RepID=A0A073CEZ2_PLAA1|nr:MULTISPECIES: hypothetical protein [Planktothrix]CAD5935041.1 hypothetical protein NO108_01923 [Planktothrix rubescens]KEI66238.1 hypothetical protein A19Y_1142 [Planktothrix agardhii NIVA-CYA 126/8]MBG0747765.1 hypothetical protein [Planktothrix agardhii KL2]MCB8760947.1 hypothetical protein [Planktothrix agardhii 1813]MCB8763243.1 hypothetical protein [Planktothrix agardhii 1809]